MQNGELVKIKTAPEGKQAAIVEKISFPKSWVSVRLIHDESIVVVYHTELMRSKS